MKPTLYPSNETEFATNGLGRLSDAVSCTVAETLNGAYELSMEYPIGGAHYADISEDCIILARHDDTEDTQPFRVVKITPSSDKGTAQVKARHISYDLSRVTVLPFIAPSVSAAMRGIKSHSVTEFPYSLETDMTATGRFEFDAPVSVRAALGADGNVSVLGTYGGELEWDRFTVRLRRQRGADNGVSIRYCKNLKSLEKTTEGGTYNAIVPYYRSNEGVMRYAPGYVVSVGEYTDAPPVDVSDRFDYAPEPSQVAQAGLDWLAEQKPYITPKSINIDFAALWQTEEYKDYAPIQRVTLGDTVTVRYAALGVDDKLRLVKTVYDVLNERYADVVLGSTTPTVASKLHDTVATLTRQIDAAKQIVSQIANGTYTGGTFLDRNLIYSPNIYGGATLHIGSNPSVDEGYNFNVNSSGDLESYGSVYLLGDDTVIKAPRIYADSFNVFPSDLDDEDYPDTLLSGYNLYGYFGGRLLHYLRIYAYDTVPPIAAIYNPSRGWISFASETRFSAGVDFARADVTGLETSGYVMQADISGFVTRADVQQMIDNALGGDEG